MQLLTGGCWFSIDGNLDTRSYTYVESNPWLILNFDATHIVQDIQFEAYYDSSWAAAQYIISLYLGDKYIGKIC